LLGQRRRTSEEGRLSGRVADGGLVEAAARGVVEVLGEDLGGGLDDEARDFAADFGEHLDAVGFDGGLGLGDDFGLGGLGFGLGGLDGGLGGVAGFGEDAGGFVGSGVELGVGSLLGFGKRWDRRPGRRRGPCSMRRLRSSSRPRAGFTAKR
jgi:hypothetical protein